MSSTDQRMADFGTEMLQSLHRVAVQVQAEAPPPRTTADVTRLQGWHKLQRGLEAVMATG